MSPSSDHPITPSPSAFVLPRLYAILDPAQTGGRPLLEIADQLLEAGVRLIQLRDKKASASELYSTGMVLAERIRKAGGIFVINDRADVARAIDADGVHVGQEDLPVESARALLGSDKLIGHSTHNITQLVIASRSPVDYLAYGPIFTTSSKENPDAVVGLSGLRAARASVRRPLVAIGGITLENARSVLEAGADSVAVIRDLIGARDVRTRAEEFLAAVNG